MDENIVLFCKQGSSDKEYHLQLKAEGAGYMVFYQNGRRGGTLRPGTKTAAPVDYEVAKKAYDKTVKEKLREGYTPGEGAGIFVGTSLEERFTGILPQLLNAIDDEAAEVLLQDPAWVLQEKYDGHRRLVQGEVPHAPPQGINRKGLATGLPESVVLALQEVNPEPAYVVDGELMGDLMAVFDVLEWGGIDFRTEPYEVRLRVLAGLATRLRDTGISSVFVAPTARTEAEKRALYAKLKAEGREGGVFKRLDAPYTAGRPNSGGDQLKRKFTHSATVIVVKKNATKRSVQVAGLDGQGTKVPLGNVTIPANQEVPSSGALVEVEYLYAYRKGSLYQPQYKGVRDDIDFEACTLTQLHYKEEGDEDDEG